MAEMQARVNDTSPEAERVQITIYRNMSMEGKWRTLQSLYRTGRELHEMGYRQRHPDATPEELVDDWMRLTLGPEIYCEVRKSIDGPLS